MHFDRRKVGLVLALWLTLLVVGSAGLMVLVANAAAAPNGSAPISSTTTTTPPKEIVGNVDSDLAVVDYSVKGSTFRVTLESDGYNLVKLSDYSGVSAQGFHKIPSKRLELQPDETRTVTFDLENPSRAAVGVATADGAAALSKRHKPMFGTTFNTTQVRLVGLAGLAAGLTSVLGVVWTRRRGRDGPERVR